MLEITYHLNRVLGRIKDEGEVVDKTHVCIYSKQTIIQLLKRYFELLEFAYLDMYLKSKKKLYILILKLIQKIFPDFSEGLLIASKARRIR